MQLVFIPALTLTCLLTVAVRAQVGSPLLAGDLHPAGEMGEDAAPEFERYQDLVQAIGGDSIRYCDAVPCSGWVEDRFPHGALMHRGYYEDGRLLTYRNLYEDGKVEREFKALDAMKCHLRTYHPNGNVRSGTRYVNGVVHQYQDHYVDGRLRYLEERHRTEPYHLRTEFRAPNGDLISTLELIDRKKVEFIQRDHYPGGAVMTEGRARYDPKRMDIQRFGTWMYFAADGSLVREEAYIDGRVHR